MINSRKQDPVVVSYFTRGTCYETEAEALRLSCEQVGLEYRIEGIEPFGKWHEHTCHKPIYILEKMKELRRPIVWIDADAEVVKRPVFDFDCDIGVRICDAYPADHPSHVYAGTVYLDWNEKALAFVEAWAAECRRAMTAGEFTVDQQVLGRLLLKGNLKVGRLPDSYVAIFEEEMEERFIIHYQASRLYKKVVDGELVFGVLGQLSIDELRKLRPRTK
jgi:hypothetical protein